MFGNNLTNIIYRYFKAAFYTRNYGGGFKDYGSIISADISRTLS